jgi:hypothetical protein
MNRTIIRKLRTVLNAPKTLLVRLLYLFSPCINDKTYLKLLFPLKLGYKLNLKNPKSYNEKLNWLKLYYRDATLPRLVDKYEYKEHVKKIIGESFVIKTYGIWDSFEEIDFDSLPQKFVLKTTHDQGGVIICKDKYAFNFEKAHSKIQKHLKRNLFYLMREWPYKYVRPRIIAEEYLVDESGTELKDYKFYCFNGIPKFMYIASGRQAGHHFDFYDMDFNHLDISRTGYTPSGVQFKKPKNWDMMKEFAMKMSLGHPHVRIDFYNINEKLLFGEFTLFQGGGLMRFYPPKWDYEFGKYLQLPPRNN